MENQVTLTENKFILKGHVEERPMTTTEVFSCFVRGKNTLKISSQDIDKITSSCKFQRTFVDLRAKLILCDGLVNIQIGIRLNKDEIIVIESSRIIKSAIEIGYIVIEATWYALSEESISELEILINSFDYSDSQLQVGAVFKFLGLNSSRYLDSTEISFEEIIDKGELEIDHESSLFKLDLYDYQKTGLRWLQFCGINKIGTILGDDMGLGKTAQVISFICWCMEVELYDKFLIVVPSTLMENWRREFLFFTGNEIEPYIHHGAQRTGLARVLEEQKLVVTTYSLIINDITLFQSVEWGCLVLDEASLIKNPESERTQFIKSVDADVKVAMTGTPVENSLLDLWSISDFCNSGYLGDLEEFKASYHSQNIESNLQNNNLPRLKELVSNIMIRRMKEDLLDTLPDKIDVHQALNLSPRGTLEYESVRQEIINGDEGNRSIMFKLIQKLYRFCAHPVLLEEEPDRSVPNLLARSNKFQRTFEMLDEIRSRNEKVLIFTDIIAMIDLLMESISSNFGIHVFNIDGRISTNERQNVIDSFSQVNGFSVMVLNPTTAGMGLNIVAANHVIHYTRQWNPALELQASARAYRNGQKKGVNIYYPYYVNTLEETIDERLRQKSALADSVIDITENNDEQISHIYNILKNKIT